MITISHLISVDHLQDPLLYSASPWFPLHLAASRSFQDSYISFSISFCTILTDTDSDRSSSSSLGVISSELRICAWICHRFSSSCSPSTMYLGDNTFSSKFHLFLTFCVLLCGAKI